MSSNFTDAEKELILVEALSTEEGICLMVWAMADAAEIASRTPEEIFMHKIRLELHSSRKK